MGGQSLDFPCRGKGGETGDLGPDTQVGRAHADLQAHRACIGTSQVWPTVSSPPDAYTSRFFSYDTHVRRHQSPRRISNARATSPTCMSEAGVVQDLAPQETRAQHGSHGERGGSMHFDEALADDSMDFSATGSDGVESNTISSPRHVRFPPGHHDNTSGTSSAIQSLTSASTLSTLESKLDLSPTDAVARRGVLRDSIFGEWRDDAPNLEPETPEEMQKKDPLGTQIWKLYHKQKGQLPNSERLENLSWRMMSMNLRRKELERRG